MNLNQVTVPATDLEKSIIFYQKLGLKLIVKSMPHYARFECPDGDSTFSLHQVEQKPKGEGVVVYFECKELDNHVKTLQNKGIRFSEKPTDKSWLWREARLEDPDGNKLILFFAGEDRKNPPWKLNPDIKIRFERTQDHDAIRKVNDLAFSRKQEGELVDALRISPGFNPALSLVAELDGRLVGHILFFPVTLEVNQQAHMTLSLSPMAVVPDFQKKGIGSMLINQGLQTAKKLGFESVVVVGDEQYYQMFGFVHASRWGIKNALDVPENACMIQELVEGGLKDKKGIVKYPPPFQAV